MNTYKIEFTPAELNTAFIGAVRYYLGRGSIRDNSSFVKNHLKDLDIGTLKTILQDIILEIEYDKSMEPDARYVPVGYQWVSLVPLIEQELKSRVSNVTAEDECEDCSEEYGSFTCSKCGCHISDVSVIENGYVRYCPDCGKFVSSD